jgi:hypothetical protein
MNLITTQLNAVRPRKNFRKIEWKRPNNGGHLDR